MKTSSKLDPYYLAHEIFGSEKEQIVFLSFSDGNHDAFFRVWGRVIEEADEENDFKWKKSDISFNYVFSRIYDFCKLPEILAEEKEELKLFYDRGYRWITRDNSYSGCGIRLFKNRPHKMNRGGYWFDPEQDLWDYDLSIDINSPDKFKEITSNVPVEIFAILKF